MNKKKIYDNYLSNIYAGSERLSKIEKEYLSMYFWNKKYVAPFFPSAKKSKILDVGCGLGQNLFTFTKLGYKNITGIDLSEECVSFCRGRGYEVIETSVEKYLKSKKNIFDVITVYHLVEHINKKKIISFLKLLRFSLKKNGVLVINVPNGGSAITGVHDRYVDITHEILYTSESLREVLILSGFDSKRTVIRELVAYSPGGKSLFSKVVRSVLLPIMTFCVDLIWYAFFISQGVTPKKNRPVLLSVSVKES